MADHAYWLAVCRAAVCGHHSRMARIWDRLTPSRRGVLLHAANMEARFCYYQWRDFSQRELHQMKRGITRLRALADLFTVHNAWDFRMSAPVASGQEQPPSQAEKALVPQVSKLLQQRAALLQQLSTAQSGQGCDDQNTDTAEHGRAVRR